MGVAGRRARCVGGTGGWGGGDPKGGRRGGRLRHVGAVLARSPCDTRHARGNAAGRGGASREGRGGGAGRARVAHIRAQGAHPRRERRAVRPAGGSTGREGKRSSPLRPLRFRRARAAHTARPACPTRNPSRFLTCPVAPPRARRLRRHELRARRRRASRLCVHPAARGVVAAVRRAPRRLRGRLLGVCGPDSIYPG